MKHDEIRKSYLWVSNRKSNLSVVS